MRNLPIKITIITSSGTYVLIQSTVTLLTQCCLSPIFSALRFRTAVGAHCGKALWHNHIGHEIVCRRSWLETGWFDFRRCQSRAKVKS